MVQASNKEAVQIYTSTERKTQPSMLPAKLLKQPHAGDGVWTHQTKLCKVTHCSQLSWAERLCVVVQVKRFSGECGRVPVCGVEAELGGGHVRAPDSVPPAMIGVSGEASWG